MKAILFCSFCALIALGCASTQPVDMPDRLPHLVEQEPFPPLPGGIGEGRLVFDLKLQIAENGTVMKGEILNPSGDSAWDAAALTKIKNWVFTPAMQNGKPLSMWINIAAKIKYEEPMYMTLAEIVCATPEVADSVYTLISGGKDFGVMASTFSVSASKDKGGKLGEIDICRYRDDVRKTLSSLSEDEVTRPLTVGEKYVIFKRLPSEIRFQ